MPRELRGNPLAIFDDRSRCKMTSSKGRGGATVDKGVCKCIRVERRVFERKCKNQL